MHVSDIKIKPFSNSYMRAESLKVLYPTKFPLSCIHVNFLSGGTLFQLLFGMACGKDNNNLRKLNFCLLFANYYLHYLKVNERNLDWIEFTTKVNSGVNYKLRIGNQVFGSL